MGTRRLAVLSCAVLFAVMSFAAGCGKDGKDGKKEKKMAGLCADAERILTDLSKDPSGDSDLFMKTMSNAIEACEAGCTKEKDDASCGRLDKIVGTVCSASPTVCKNLCEVKDGKKYSEIACAKSGS